LWDREPYIVDRGSERIAVRSLSGHQVNPKMANFMTVAVEQCGWAGYTLQFLAAFFNQKMASDSHLAIFV
jgi:hypothetical protein